MIYVTRFDGKKFFLNAEWIRSVEETPDTVITLTTGEKILVKDSAQEVAKLVKTYRTDIARGTQLEAKP